MSMPHDYSASAHLKPQGSVALRAEGLTEIESEPPVQFGGTGTKWSPEDLLIAAVADCMVLSFKAVAAASKFEWAEVDCEVTGTLDRVERTTSFTHLKVSASLKLPADGDAEKAKRVFEKAKSACFISNSLKADTTLEVNVTHV